MKLNPDPGIAASITAPLFIAISILLAKVAGQHSQALFVAGLGSLISVPFLLAASLLKRSNLEPAKLFNQARSSFLQVLFSRALFGQALIILGFTMTTAVKSILLLRLEPVFVFFWSVLLLGEKPTRGKAALLSLLLLGSLLVVWPQDKVSAPNTGDGLILLSLLFLSYSYIPTGKAIEQSSAAALNLFTNLIGGGTIAALALTIYGASSFPTTATAWGPILAYSISFCVIGASLYFYAFNSVKPWVISSFLSLEVVYGLILAVIFMAEKLTALQCTGALVLLSATLLIALYRRLEERKSEAIIVIKELEVRRSPAKA